MEFSDKQISEKTPPPYIAGLLCRCPRCGKGKLFEGFLTLKSKCDVCVLDFSFADAGDGPAIFVIMIAGAIVVGAALVTVVKYQPPYWVHAVLWIPLIRHPDTVRKRLPMASSQGLFRLERHPR